MNSLIEILSRNPVVLAPLAGVSNRAFRRVCRMTGAQLCYTEMVSSEAVVRSNRKTLDSLLATDPEDRPTVVQIFGADPAHMAETARRLDKSPFTAIDINMGCPAPKVEKSGGGAALMKDPDHAAEIVRAIRENTAKPVTIKTRLGLDSQSQNYLELSRKCVAKGACLVTLHPRTAEQAYSGVSNWTHVKILKEELPVPVIGSGDIRTPEQAFRRLSETGADGLMIGRGSFGNPWIFREIFFFLQTGQDRARPTSQEKHRIIRKHLELMQEDMGKRTAVLHMRKHLSWYIRGFPGAAEIRDTANRITEYTDALKLIDRIFTRNTEKTSAVSRPQRKGTEHVRDQGI